MDSRNRNRIQIRAEIVHACIPLQEYSTLHVLVVSPIECTFSNSRYVFIDHLSSFKNIVVHVKYPTRTCHQFQLFCDGFIGGNPGKSP